MSKILSKKRVEKCSYASKYKAIYPPKCNCIYCYEMYERRKKESGNNSLSK
jgi:hypothetical protein